MTRFLIYLFPAVADMILAATMFVCSNRLADAGRSRTEVAMVFALWAVLYIASTQVLARLVTSRNAAAMLIVANLLFTAMAGALADRFGFAAFPAVLAAMIVAAAMLQFVVLKRLAGKLAESTAQRHAPCWQEPE